MQVTFPTYLTLLRIGLIPFVILFFMLNIPSMRIVAAILFIIASFTDWLDGVLARKMSQVSKLGEFLDPVADKILIGTVLFILGSEGQLSFLSVIASLIIIAREFIITQLRESVIAPFTHVKVIFLAKWKTFLQMMAISFLLIGNSYWSWTQLVGEALLCVAAFITLVTGYAYLKHNIDELLSPQGEENGKETPS